MNRRIYMRYEALLKLRKLPPVKIILLLDDHEDDTNLLSKPSHLWRT